MKSHERATMTPLEMAVWAAAYAHGGPTFPLEHADTAVELLRERLAKERQAELLADAKALHHIIMPMQRTPPYTQTVRCSCGYVPSPGTKDADELMALHMAYVCALSVEDIK